MAPKVLLVSEDDALVNALSKALEYRGFGVLTCRADVPEHVAGWLSPNVDAVVYDASAMGVPLAAAASTLRSSTRVPVLLLHAPGKSCSDERTAALDAGADDCLRRSTCPDLLAAHVVARLRLRRGYTSAATAPDLVRVGALTVDSRRRRVAIKGREKRLTRKEFDLLIALAANAGAPVSSEKLLQRVWGYGPDCRTRTLNVHIHRLRAKLEARPSDPALILTVPGFGYKLALPAAESVARRKAGSLRRRRRAPAEGKRAAAPER